MLVISHLQNPIILYTLRLISWQLSQFPPQASRDTVRKEHIQKESSQSHHMPQLYSAALALSENKFFVLETPIQRMTENVIVPFCVKEYIQKGNLP